jgi:hypothetical protein
MALSASNLFLANGLKLRRPLAAESSLTLLVPPFRDGLFATAAVIEGALPALAALGKVGAVANKKVRRLFGRDPLA